jgi:hypothetical protein
MGRVNPARPATKRIAVALRLARFRSRALPPLRAHAVRRPSVISCALASILGSNAGQGAAQMRHLMIAIGYLSDISSVAQRYLMATRIDSWQLSNS